MKKHTRKNIISTVITIIILLGGLMVFQVFSGMKKSTVSNKAVKKERRKVQVTTFNPQTMDNPIEIDGRLKAHEVVNVSSKVTGVMQAGGKSVKEGKYFKKGELLFDIDSREATFDLKAEKSSFLTTITQIMPDLKFDYPEAFGHWEKYLQSIDINRPIRPLPEPTTSQERYYIAGKNIYNLYYKIKSQETRLQDYKIYAPFSGVVTSVNIFPGALISPGTVLATMINTSYYELDSPVPLSSLKYVKVGQKVKLYSLEMDQEWQGKVNRIGTQIDANTQNVPIYIAVAGSNLKDGMYLKGSLQGAALDGVMELPKRIFLNPESIYVVKDSTLVEQQIIPVKRTDQSVIIRGITANDKVVTGSLAGLFTGQKVTY